MKRTLVTILITGMLSVSCAPKTPTSGTDDFLKANIEQSKTSFKKVYGGDLNETDVKVVTVQELNQWIKDGPWASRELPCELKEILSGGGVTDPSPIALDVSGSAPAGASRLLYVPIHSKVTCPSAKSDFFLDDVTACTEDKKVMVCNGGIGGSCTCSCIFVCDAAPTDCNLC